LLGDVHELAAAVVALARIALRVLVGHHRADRLQHRLGDEVLRRDQLEVAGLPLGLRADRLGDLGVGLLERAHRRSPACRTSTSAILATRRAWRAGAQSGLSADWRMA